VLPYPSWDRGRRTAVYPPSQVDDWDLMVRLRIKYEKRGPIRYTSHRDLLRIFRRCIAAGEIPVRFSQGFNPHPRFSFGPSLRTGWEGLDEYLDVYLETAVDDPVPTLNANLPDGVRVVETAPVVESVPKLSADVKAARFGLVFDDAVREEIDGCLDERPSDGNGGGDRSTADTLESALRSRLGLGVTDTAQGAGQQTAPEAGPQTVLPVVTGVSVKDSAARGTGEATNTTDTNDVSFESGIYIEYTSTMDGGRTVPPEELVTPVLGNPDRLSIPMRVIRTGLFVERRGEYLSPIDRAVVEKQV
jgi:hypothetical protein